MTNLEHWENFTRDIESPTVFIQWPLYFLIGSALQRRVWIGEEGGLQIFPNIYVIAVGPPGCGKTLPAALGLKFVSDVHDPDPRNVDPETQIPQRMFPVAPDSTTLQALTQALAKNVKIFRYKDGENEKIYASSPMLFLCEEFSVLLRHDTEDVVSFLLQGYDARDYKRATKHCGNDFIKNVCISLYACTTLDFLRRGVATSLISEGFSGRCIFLWAETKRFRKAFIELDKDQIESRKIVVKQFEQLSKLYGKVTFSPEAKAAFIQWYEHDFEESKVNRDPQLGHYYERKKVHLYKMSMICHFLEKTSMTIDLEDFQKAQKALAISEIHMHRALASTTRNPLFQYTGDIESMIAKNGVASLRKLRLMFGQHLSLDEIDSVMTYLESVNKVKKNIKEGEVVYSLCKLSP